MKIAILTNRLDNRGNYTNGTKIGKALKKNGYEVMNLSHKYLNYKVIEKADFILAFGTIIYPGNVKEIEMIADRKRKDAIFALWYFDVCNPASNYGNGKEKHGRIMRNLQYLDWLITTDHSFPWEEHAKNYLHLMQGVDPDEFKCEPDKRARKNRDVIFTGGIKGCFKERMGILKQIGKRFSLVIYGSDSMRQVFGQNFFSAYQQARVAYVPPPPSSVRGQYWSNRIYLATATGTPCVVGYTKGLEGHFEDGKEVLFFNDGNEACDAIQGLLKDSDLRWQMGMAARERTLREHTYQRRASQLMNTIFKREV